MPDTPAILPAAPDTRIIEMADVGPVRTPVVFWALDAANPYRAPLPVTVQGIRKAPCAIEFGEGGMVHEPDLRIPFKNADEWAAWAERVHDVEMADIVGADLESETPKEETTGDLGIEWSTKPFKSNSWYRFSNADLDFLFQVDGGLNPPKQKGAVTKIKRTEFMELKKTIDVADYDDLVEGRAPGMDDIGNYEADETEAPDEEFDDGGLI